MKVNLGKRIILFFHWLISVILLLCVAFSAIPQWLAALLGHELSHTLFIVFAIAYALLCAATAWVIFQRGPRRAERGFITVDSSDAGRVRIAVSAVEQMVKQAVRSVDGISEMKIAISGEDDALAIVVNVVLLSGTHVPTVTMNMQRAIRQFIEANCGVSVQSVSINIQSVALPAEPGSRKGRRFSSPASAQPVDAEPIVPATAAEPEPPAADEPAMSDEPEIPQASEPESVQLDLSADGESEDALVDDAADYVPAEPEVSEAPAGLGYDPDPENWQPEPARENEDEDKA